MIVPLYEEKDRVRGRGKLAGDERGRGERRENWVKWEGGENAHATPKRDEGDKGQEREVGAGGGEAYSCLPPLI